LYRPTDTLIKHGNLNGAILAENKRGKSCFGALKILYFQGSKTDEQLKGTGTGNKKSCSTTTLAKLGALDLPFFS